VILIVLIKKTSDLYYLSDVFDEAIEILYYYPTETIIMHLKNENEHLTELNT